MFTILLSILFSASILAAPPPQSDRTKPWVSLKDDKSLVQYQSTLLNTTMLTFLNDCNQDPLGNMRNQIPCLRYFDAIRQLNSTNYVVEVPTIEKLLNEASKDKGFCKRNHTFPAIKYYLTPPEDFNDEQICGNLCIQIKGDEFVLKPICAFLAWMAEEIAKNSSKSAILPATAADGVASSTNKTANDAAAAANVGRDPAKVVMPEFAVAAKPEFPNVQTPTGSKGNVIVQQPPSTSNETSQVRAENVIQPKHDSAEGKENSAPKIPVAVTPAPGAAAAPPLPPKEEKPKIPLPPPAKDQDQEEPSAAINPDTQEEETPLKGLPTNSGKHESPIDPQANEEQQNENDSEGDLNEETNPEDNDDENDDFDMNQQKLKPKDPQLARPDETEDGQKNSQEIFDRNYLPNTNHVTDPFLEESGSNFFTYFLVGMFLCIVMYVVYHNKSKVLALLLEGRRSDKGRNGRRKHTAAYRKLDSNLEEAITSSASGRTTQIIY